jgi:hypothetical protein
VTQAALPFCLCWRSNRCRSELQTAQNAGVQTIHAP